MSFTGSTELNQMGGIPGGWGSGFGGGFGGFGLFGLLGLRGIGDLDGRRGGEDCCEDIKNNARNLAVLEAIQNNNSQVVAEGRALAGAICESEKTNLQQFYAAAIQAANNTSQLSNQISASNVVIDKRFDDLTLAGVNQTAAILAKIGQVEIDGLRDQLNHAHRRADGQDVAINIQNSATAIAQQQQQQFQTLKDEQRNWFNAFANQLNKNSSDVINLGTMVASGNQANQQTNIK